jgi:hypothetical protein
VHFPGGGPFLSGTYDTLKIWLITYNPGTLMLEASDSITTLIDSAEDYYYQFLSEPADSYRVKAAVHMVTFTGTGYIPTYHTSSYYWHDADVFYHVTTSADDGEDINMAFGTTISGPGFISGNVSMGANKGTSVTIPAVGLLIFAINSSGTLIQQVYTDASGNYSFSSLPLGTYTIYPEEINYNTTAYTGITLTSSSSSMSGADFGQHTVSKTILPITSGIKNTPPAATSIITFPNPTAGKLNILWNETTNEKSNVTLTDITGRKIYSAVLNMNAGSGSSQIDLSGIENGIYMMTIESGTINYKNKLEIQQ